MGLVVRCRQGTEGLGCTGSDGAAGTAYELEHFAATRCWQQVCVMADYVADRIADESEIRRRSSSVPVLRCVLERG